MKEWKEAHRRGERDNDMIVQDISILRSYNFSTFHSVKVDKSAPNEIKGLCSRSRKKCYFNYTSITVRVFQENISLFLILTFRFALNRSCCTLYSWIVFSLHLITNLPDAGTSHSSEDTNIVVEVHVMV